MDRKLIITADDFGLRPSYDAGILEAVRAGAVDAVSVMVLRVSSIPDDLGEAGCAVGLHLEGEGVGSLLSGEVKGQLDDLARLLGRAPDYLDGHHHCHARPGVAEEVAASAASLDLPVRSVSDEHREMLRAAGVRTPDQLIGRFTESQQVLPAELGALPEGWTEWMTHPGHPDPDSGSSYDAGRGKDLQALLALSLPDGIDRADHRGLPGPHWSRPDPEYRDL